MVEQGVTESGKEFQIAGPADLKPREPNRSWHDKKPWFLFIQTWKARRLNPWLIDWLIEKANDFHAFWK